jgi:diacylglycerol kinase (ATP)
MFLKARWYNISEMTLLTRKKKNFSERTCCIINPYAANRRWKRNKLLREYFKRIFPVQIIDTQEDKFQTIRAVQKLCRKHDVIVAAGGDGTIADVIEGIVSSGKSEDIIMGIIPFGSGNAFRSSLGLPKSLWRCVNFISEGKYRTIDLMDIEGKPAAFGSIGATARVVVEKLKHPIPGFFGHLLASSLVLNLPRKRMEIEMFDGINDEGEPFEHKALNLKVFDAVLGKAKHFGYGWRVAPKAKMDDGYIDLTLFETSGLKYILLFPLIYLGFYQRFLKHYKAKRIIFRGKNLPIQYHGELMGVKNEIEVNITPKALKIITPLPENRL